MKPVEARREVQKVDSPCESTESGETGSGGLALKVRSGPRVGIDHSVLRHREAWIDRPPLPV